jgi:hypothetical protein
MYMSDIVSQNPDDDNPTILEHTFDNIPGKSEHGGYVYVLQFSGDILKVGRSVNPKNRLPQHAQMARSFNQRLLKCWVSPPHPTALKNERSLIKFCAQIMDRTTGLGAGEYFSGDKFEDVVNFAKTLPCAKLTPTERADRDARDAALWDGLWRVLIGLDRPYEH